MKRVVIAAASALSAFGTPALATDVGVSISVGQPGFYGRIDIGGYPPPVLIYPEPIIVERVTVVRPPVYLRVPPGHAKNWKKYCGQYRACGERVYFVRDDWYANEYVPRYKERHGHPKYENRGGDHKEGKQDGQGKGHGKGPKD